MYNEAIKQYPVDTGDLWKLNDLHSFYCGNFEDYAKEIPTVDFIYTDPPWNQTILNKFYDSCNQPRVKIEELLQKFAQTARSICPTGTVFVEFGIPTAHLMHTAFIEAGAKSLQVASCQYGQMTHMILEAFTFDPNRKYIPLVMPHGKVNWEICRETLRANNLYHKTMADLFCGEGYFPRIAMEFNNTVYGSEIIPDKFASMIKKTKGEWTWSRNLYKKI